jgi:hypothetical protein
MATSLQPTSGQISTPDARIVSHDKNSLFESVRLSFTTLQEAQAFIREHEPAFSDFAVVKQTRWVKKPVILICLKTNAGSSVVEITDKLTKIFNDITFKKSPPPKVKSPESLPPLPTPEIGLVRSSPANREPDVAYVYLKVRGYALQFLAEHAHKFTDFATVKSVGRSNITVRIALKPNLGVTIAKITDVLKQIYPGVKIMDGDTLRAYSDENNPRN